MKSVRRVMREFRTGTTLTRDLRIKQVCATPLCVHPDHTVDQWTRVNGLYMGQPDLPPEDSIEDAASAIYSRPEPWDAQALAREFDYPLDLIERALTEIREGRM